MTDVGNRGPLSRTATAVLALAAGVAIANGYALQPSLSAIASEFGVAASRMAALASVTMLGYLVGLAVLVPLVDRFSPRVLVSMQMGALALLLACASLSPGPLVLDAAFFWWARQPRSRRNAAPSPENTRIRNGVVWRWEPCRRAFPPGSC